LGEIDIVKENKRDFEYNRLKKVENSRSISSILKKGQPFSDQDGI